MENSLLSKAYDPSKFNEEGHQLVEQLTSYLEKSLQGQEKANRWKTPAEQLKYWQDYLNNGEQDIQKLFKDILDNSLHMHNRKNMGHQVAVPAPETALAGLLGELLNNGTVVYEIGSTAVVMEKIICRKISEFIGFDEKSDGFMTSGASLANLTSMLAARSNKAHEDVWTVGVKKQYAIIVSEEAHYCVEKAAHIMGFGDAGVIKVPVGKDYKMRTDLLESYYQKAVDKGIEVLAVVGCACSTSTGIYDDLDKIADFAEAHNLWFHVDGAHGGPAMFSEKHKHLLKGVHRADSVVMDFHKMMMTPAISTMVIFKNGNNAYHTFSQKAQYLWEEPVDAEWYNLGQQTFECTKLMMSIKVYTLIKLYGMGIFGEYVDKTYALGKAFASIIKKHPTIELALEPETNVVCFRYHPTDKNYSEEKLSELNAHIRKELLEDGNFYIVQTRLKGVVWMRVSIMNAFTQEEDFENLLKSIEEIASR